MADRTSYLQDMKKGYPAIADVLTYLNSRGLEWPLAGKETHVEDIWMTLWAIANFADFCGALGVYKESDTTYRVRGGSYVFGGEVKTYALEAAVDPTDNDTTYIWMDPDGTVDAAVDGTGWPATDHIKLASIVVDADGVITSITDLRGQGLLRAHAMERPEVFILTATLTAGSTVAIYTADAPFKLRVIDAWSVAKSADEGSWKLTDGTNDITNAVAVTAADKTVDRVGTIDDAYHEIAADGSLSVVGDGSLADVVVYIECIKVL
ncbi:MAG: hypothetical protein WC551_11065 [Patescibacteria group bacterium]